MSFQCWEGSGQLSYESVLGNEVQIGILAKLSSRMMKAQE